MSFYFANENGSEHLLASEQNSSRLFLNLFLYESMIQ